MPLHCRFYENQYPEKGDVVKVNVRSIETAGSYVELLEYDNIEGLILHSELSRRRIRSINKLMRVDRPVIVVVTRVDTDQGYIDLSKRQALNDDILKCVDRFAKAKKVNQILRNTAEILGYETNEQLIDLCKRTSWYFDKKAGKKAASFEVFKKIVLNPSLLDECDIDEKTREVLITNIRHRLTPQAMKIRADFEISSFVVEGIDAIKRALHAGLELNSEQSPIKINLIAPPLYVLTTQNLDRIEGIELLNRVLETIRESIESQGGIFRIQQAPRLVSESDEADLKRQMAELEEANLEVSGDEDEDEDEDEMEQDEEDEEEEEEGAVNGDS